MKISKKQMQLISLSIFACKLDAILSRSLTGYAQLDSETRVEFLNDVFVGAAVAGFKSEQGIGAYALSLWYLDRGFEKRSRYMQVLLASQYPEVRRVHAMNAWVESMRREPTRMDAADEALRLAFQATQAWGGPI